MAEKQPEKKIQDNDIAVIQVYSSRHWHEPQAIVLNEPGRQRLIQALEAGKERIAVEAITDDGEGYDLAIICQDWDTIMHTIQEPYIPDPSIGLTIDESKQDPRYMIQTGDPRIPNVSLHERITKDVIAWLWPSAKDHYKMECNCDMCRFVRVVAGHEVRRVEGKSGENEEWVPVTDRLPKDACSVFVNVKHEIGTQYFRFMEYLPEAEGFQPHLSAGEVVTHWRIINHPEASK